MAFVPGFEHDIFISYAHVDNETVSQTIEGWVDQFHKHLQLRLAREFGRTDKVKIWRDYRIEGGQLFDKTIQEAMDRSAIFLCLTSKPHMASEYCQKEIDWFHNKASNEKEGLGIGDRHRLVNCLVDDISHLNWNEKLGRTSGFPFFDEREDGDRTNPEIEKFERQIRKLGKFLYSLLSEYKNLKDHAIDPIKSPPGGVTEMKADVFIAEVADSLTSARKRLIAELDRKGCHVVTGIPPPYDKANHDRKVADILEQVPLSVHLLDHLTGREFDDTPDHCFPQSQVEMAQEKKKNSLIWVPQDLSMKKIEVEGHRSFMKNLEEGQREGFEYDFIRGSSVDLASQIIEKLEQIKSPVTSDSPMNAVLLDTHVKDQKHALELLQYFMDKNIQPYMNPQNDDPNENLDILESRLSQVNILMILFGHVNGDWVRQRLAAALQLSVRKALALKAFCVVNVPPAKPKDALNFNFGPIPVHLIDNSSGSFDPGQFAPILEGLETKGL